MSFLGLVTANEFNIERISTKGDVAYLHERIDKLEEICRKHAESIRYTKDEISKIRRGKMPGQTTFRKTKPGVKKRG